MSPVPTDDSFEDIVGFSTQSCRVASHGSGELKLYFKILSCINVYRCSFLLPGNRYGLFDACPSSNGCEYAAARAVLPGFCADSCWAADAADLDAV
jgi:hypothetical protein